MGESIIIPGDKMYTRAIVVVAFVAFLSCVNASVQDNVFALTDDTQENFFGRRTDVSTYYTNKALTEEEQNFLISLTEYGFVGTVNCKTDPDACLDHGIKIKSLPTFAVNRDAKKRVVFEGDLSDRDGLKQWARELILGDFIPINNAESLDKLSTGEWFLKFYAPWCGHCKSLAPTWREISTELKGEVNVAKIDCTVDDLKDFCENNDVKGFPTLQFWRDGLNVGTFDLGDRSREGLLEWLQQTRFPVDEDNTHEEL